MHDRPRGVMPEGLAEKLRAARAERQMRGERRVITMLFCDVTGSTTMAERLDPEVWAEIMDQAFDYLIEPVYRYEGTLARMMGDGLLAFFGAPIAHEDDPVRAVLAGLDIVTGIQPFCKTIRQEFGFDFGVRVGINTGPVVVGDIGSDLAIEYTAMGDAINVAARMEETAVPDTVRISAYTYKQVAPLFEVEDLGPIQVKGREEPVAVYQVLGQKRLPGSLRGIQGLASPLVGRIGELEQMRRAADTVRQGQGQIVCLIGEAGLGKSRLIDELHTEWREAVGIGTWTESHGIAYEQNRAYGLINQSLIESMGISPQDSREAVRRKIDWALMHSAPEERNAFRQVIEALLALEGQLEGPRMEAEALKRALYQAVQQNWLITADSGPSVAVFDDLHWSDPASAELLIYLSNLVRQAPCLILLATRPYRDSPGWQVVEAARRDYADLYTEINLSPLSESESNSLINNLLNLADLPPEARRLILRKAEGVPLYVEEIIGSLIDQGLIVREPEGVRWQATKTVEEIDIPDNLQTLLISRIDRLEKEAKRTLQLASVIGRHFYERVLIAIAQGIGDVGAQLEALQEAGLILEAGRKPEIAYIFRHELTRDAAYQSILHRQRREYHLRVGQALETLFPDRLAEEAHRLAYHFHEAGDWPRALEYSLMAGDAAARLFANEEAIGHFRRAQPLALEVGSQEQLIHAARGLGRTLEVCNRYDEAQAVYHELAALARQRGEPQLELEALVAEATMLATYTVKFNPERAWTISQQALNLAVELADPAAEARIYWNLMLVLIATSGDPEKASRLGERSLAIARQYDLRGQLAFTLNDLARTYAMLGRYDDAQAASEEAAELFREQGNWPMLADTLATRSTVYYEVGDLEQAKALAEEGLRLSRTANSLWGQAFNLARLSAVYLEWGWIDEALSTWEGTLFLAQEANFLVPELLGPNSQVFIAFMLERWPQALAAVDEATGRASDRFREVFDIYAEALRAYVELRIGNPSAAETILSAIPTWVAEHETSPIIRAEFLTMIGEVLIGLGRPEEALQLTQEAADRFEASGTCIGLPRVRHAKAKALIALGQVEQARAELQKVLEQAQDSGSRRQLWPVMVSLGRLENEHGRPDEAQRLFRGARTIIEEMASHTGDSQLSEALLNLPDVRLIMESSGHEPESGA